MLPLCKCGCGKPVGLATATRKAQGRIKGMPTMYLKGHRIRRLDLCARSNCTLPRVKTPHGTNYCEMHSRFIQMRSVARKCDKSVPSTAELEGLVPADMKCEICSCQMTWFRIDGERKQQITLQHDHSGVHRLICMNCNMRHATFPGDSFYTMPKDSHYCTKCEQFKSVSLFWRRARGPQKGALIVPCKDCRMLAYFKKKRTQHELEILYQARARLPHGAGEL